MDRPRPGVYAGHPRYSGLVLGAAMLVVWMGPAPTEPEPLPRRHTLYLEFDGAALTWIPDPDDENAALGTSFLANFEGSEVPAYDGDARDRQAVAQAVAAHMAEIGVRVVFEARPSDTVPYTMAVVGGDWTDIQADAPVRGVAPNVDCQRLNPRHTVFAFVGPDEEPAMQATTISQEAAHAWGLDHVLGPGLVMSYELDPPLTEFSDGCVPLCEEACQGPDTIFCLEEHEEHCAPGEQDSLAELRMTFGDAVPDLEAPSVDIVTPTDGEVFAPGSDIAVEASITDDFGGVGWRLLVERDAETLVDEVAFDRRTTWTLTGVPAGTYAITVEAEDHADHVTTRTVTVEVGESGGSTGGADESGGARDSGATSEASADDTGAASEGDAGGDSTTGPSSNEGGSEDGSEDGCSCHADRTAPPWWLLVLLAGLSRAGTRSGRSSSCRSRSRRRRATPRS